MALLGGRGWVARPEEGVSRTFHAEGLTARLGFQEAFYTPAEVEGLTLEVVVFTRKGEDGRARAGHVPPRVFSEVMRDLDLVVSVAHRGGVDPEATASTVEMRAALVRETCELLRIDNVELQPTHAIIRGALGQYAVHLGSAGVMLLPGTALPIVAGPLAAPRPAVPAVRGRRSPDRRGALQGAAPRPGPGDPGSEHSGVDSCGTGRGAAERRSNLVECC